MQTVVQRRLPELGQALEQRVARTASARPHLQVAAVLICTLPSLALGQESPGTDPSSGSLETVTVRARRIDERFSSTASTVTMTRQDIEASGANTVGDVLRLAPGLQVTTTANGGLEIRMRGMGPQSTRILIDGSPVSATQRTVQLPLDELPADLIDRVEIRRAPTAELEGSPGGSINIVLRSAQAKRETYVWLTDQHVWGRDALAVFLSTSGPLGGSQGSDVKKEVTDPSWTYFLSLTGGPRNLGQDVSRSSESLLGTSVAEERGRLRNETWTLTPRISGRLDGGRHQITLRPLVSVSDQSGTVSSSGTGLIGGQPLTSRADSRWQFDRQYGLFAADWNWRLDGARLESTLSVDRADSRYAMQREASADSVAGDVAATSALNEQRLERNALIRTKYTTVFDETILSGGLETGRTQLDIDGRWQLAGADTTQSVASSLSNAALWVQIEQPVESWQSTIVAGLRGQRHTLASTSPTADVKRNFDYLQPSLNSRTRLNDDLQLRLNLAQVTRTPRIWELTDRPLPSLSANSTLSPDFHGTPTLKPESTVTFDVGFDHRLARGGQAGLNFFVREQDDVIAQRLGIERGRWTARPDNVGRARVWGVESDLRTDLRWLGMAPDWALSATANVFQSRMLDGDIAGQRIPGQVRYVSTLNIAKPLKVSGGWYSGATLALTGPADLDLPGANDLRVSGRQRAFQQLDLYVGSVLPKLGFWRINVYNITDFRRDTARRVTDPSNGQTWQDGAVAVLTPRIFLTVGTRF